MIPASKSKLFGGESKENKTQKKGNGLGIYEFEEKPIYNKGNPNLASNGEGGEKGTMGSVSGAKCRDLNVG